MARWMPALTLNQKLGAAALALGAVATCARVTPPRTTTVNASELLSAVARQEDQVSPEELARWIVEGRADYRLLDLRDEKAYAAYHIPTAENVALASVADAGFRRDERLVLYGEREVHAAEAWIVLRGRRYAKAVTLAGGLEGWKDQVLFPTLPATASPEEQPRLERATSLARFFGGQARQQSANSAAPAAQPIAAPALAPPVVAAPTLPPTSGAAPAKKKKEGC